MPTDPTQDLLHLARRTGILRSRDLLRHKISRQYLKIAQERHFLRRVARGLYVPADAPPPTHHSLAQAAKRIPHGVVALLSALQFHGLTTQSPFEIWMAISVKARLPRVGDLPMRFVRFSGKALISEIQTHTIDHIPVRVYSPAKTVADCFKYRHKIGLDIALEALRDCLRQRKATIDQLHHAAQLCRVATVIRPYLESLA